MLVWPMNGASPEVGVCWFRILSYGLRPCCVSLIVIGGESSINEVARGEKRLSMTRPCRMQFTVTLLSDIAGVFATVCLRRIAKCAAINAAMVQYDVESGRRL